MKPIRKRSITVTTPCVVLLTTMTALCLAQSESTPARFEVRLMTLNPGHYHAALLQKEMLPGVAQTAYVYAPLGPDLVAHLNRVAQFNLRRDHPTRWKLEVRTGPDYFDRMLAEQPGNVVILSGENSNKIDRILTVARAGLHVLADKPWIIEADQLPTLKAALDAADAEHVIVFDAMTQHFDMACLLQRELIKDRDIFGESLKGTLEQPAVYLENLHHLLKEVAGVRNIRPPWFFDVRQQGEGLTDVGTHLVDRAQWTLFPDQAIDYERDIAILRGSHWPTVLTREQFQRVTSQRAFPDYLAGVVKSNRLDYFCNNAVSYTLRGVHVGLNVTWQFEAAPGEQDSTLAVFHGSKSSIEARQGKAEGFQTELYVVPNSTGDTSGMRKALKKRIAALQTMCPGLGLEAQPGRFRVVIPDARRKGHESHFAELGGRFLDYVREPKLLPGWEKPNMLAKYYVTTKGVALARNGSQRLQSY